MTLFRLTPQQFGSEQQTPILCDGCLYGVRQQDRQLVCLDLEGKELWNSGLDKFGLGALPDRRRPDLRAERRRPAPHGRARPPTAIEPLGKAQVIEGGVASWGPMALVAGRLIVRDLTRMVCLDVAEEPSR